MSDAFQKRLLWTDGVKVAFVFGDDGKVVFVEKKEIGGKWKIKTPVTLISRVEPAWFELVLQLVA